MKIIEVSPAQFVRYWEIMKPQERFTADIKIPNMLMFGGIAMIIPKSVEIFDAESILGDTPTLSALWRVAVDNTRPKDEVN